MVKYMKVAQNNHVRAFCHVRVMEYECEAN